MRGRFLPANEAADGALFPVPLPKPRGQVPAEAPKPAGHDLAAVVVVVDVDVELLSFPAPDPRVPGGPLAPAVAPSARCHCAAKGHAPLMRRGKAYDAAQVSCATGGTRHTGVQQTALWMSRLVVDVELVLHLRGRRAQGKSNSKSHASGTLCLSRKPDTAPLATGGCQHYVECDRNHGMRSLGVAEHKPRQGRPR